MARRKSLQTRQAGHIAADARKEWERHRTGCSACSSAARRRQLDEVCAAGARLLHAYRVTSADEELGKALDNQPDPDQGALFDEKGEATG